MSLFSSAHRQPEHRLSNLSLSVGAWFHPALLLIGGNVENNVTGKGTIVPLAMLAEGILLTTDIQTFIVR